LPVQKYGAQITANKIPLSNPIDNPQQKSYCQAASNFTGRRKYLIFHFIKQEFHMNANSNKPAALVVKSDVKAGPEMEIETDD
jgi:hypothetical protein